MRLGDPLRQGPGDPRHPRRPGRLLQRPGHRPDGVRFYAAAPIVTHDGHRLGTVNILDTRPRLITEDDTATLADLAAIVLDEMEMRLAALQRLTQ
ncbi:GAF domain-containing protein [Streptomyces sp. BK79]|uniref:GAF domain-containing protein n=1 Tax=Streptomyces sp. BK79 TaxID=3350097 RepID=UPI00377038FB